MKLLTLQIKQILQDAILKLNPDFNDFDKLFLQAATDEKFGDYQTNFAMTASKIFRKAPRVIAEEIVSKVAENQIIEKIEIAGPGFINIFVNKDHLAKLVKDSSLKKWDFSHIDTGGDIVVDYSSPNIAKPMHAGHLRTTLIGDSIKRIMKYIGYNVIADNHLGDWGTQFGKLIVAYKRWLDEENFTKEPIAELERIYIKFGKEAEIDPKLDDLARAELKKVQDGDIENLNLWKQFVEITLNECKKIYSYLDIDFDTYYGESFYHKMMPEVVEELVKKEIAVEDDGALVVFFDEKENLHPCIIRKKDGAFLYSTSDLATIKFKHENYSMSKAVYVTDDRQTAHFKQVFEIAKKLGYHIDFEHITFGIMSYNGEILSTREGNTIKLKELFNEAESRALAIVNEKNPDIPEKERAKIAKAVGIGALKYSDLSQNRTSAIDFRWDKALSFEGNTAPYLQYSYARIQSVKKKADESNIAIDHNAPIVLETEIEKRIALSIVQFPECVEKAAEHYRPNLIADHIYDLAQKFSSFYNSLPILKAENKLLQSRLQLSESVAHTIKTGLYLLGIEVVERM
ncbi:MAG: arginine--tRNA ligase [bacterium]